MKIFKAFFFLSMAALLFGFMKSGGEILQRFQLRTGMGGVVDNEILHLAVAAIFAAGVAAGGAYAST